MGKAPKISVVTVCYNSAATLEQTMLSVLGQSYPDIEYIVIDGGSTDGTVDIIKKYADRLVHWVSEPDKGIYDAMNKGIAAATGSYINFMNSGDSFYDNRVVEAIFKDGCDSADIIYGKTRKITHDLPRVQDCPPVEVLSEYLPFSHQASFSRLDLMREMRFDTKYRCAADYNFFYNVWRNNGSFREVPHIIANYDERGGFSISNKRLCMREYARINGTVRNPLWYLRYCLICLKLWVNERKK